MNLFSNENNIRYVKLTILHDLHEVHVCFIINISLLNRDSEMYLKLTANSKLHNYTPLINPDISKTNYLVLSSTL